MKLSISLAVVVVLGCVGRAATVGAQGMGGGGASPEHVGRMIFFDTGLSTNKNQSCASCHASSSGFTGPSSTVNAHGATLTALARANRGKHRVPTLRNVDRRADASFTRAYMHNGYFKTLEGLVHFLNARDVLPRCATSMSEAEALGAGCWPAPEVSGNVETRDAGNLGLTAQEEAALVAFLRTLTDGAMGGGCMMGCGMGGMGM